MKEAPKQTMQAFPFSRRTNWPREINEINRQLKLLKDNGTDIIDLAESNPTQCGFHFDEGLKELSGKESIFYKPDAKGISGARQAIRDYYRLRNVQISEDRIFLTANTSEGYAHLFRLLTNPGEQIFLPSPSYPLFSFLTDLNDVEVVSYRLDENNRFLLNLEQIKENISVQTKAIILVNPNNPTGTYISQGERCELNNICRENNCALICDEVFFDYHFDQGKNFTSFASNSDVLTFVLSGLSKILALPQMKLSWIVVNGPAEEVREATERLEFILDTYLSVNTPVQNALGRWLQLIPSIQKPINDRINSNISILKSLIAETDSTEIIDTDGGWYCLVKIGSKKNEEEFVMDLLKNDHVFIHPGYFYDFAQTGIYVLSLLVEEKRFREGVKRLINRAK